jgi:hypothetical protein
MVYSTLILVLLVAVVLVQCWVILITATSVWQNNIWQVIDGGIIHIARNSSLYGTIAELSACYGMEVAAGVIS